MRSLRKVLDLLRSIRPYWHRHGEDDDPEAVISHAEERRRAVQDRLRALEREQELMRRRRRYQQ